jgi:hypothetical protein
MPPHNTSNYSQNDRSRPEPSELLGIMQLPAGMDMPLCAVVEEEDKELQV